MDFVIENLSTLDPTCPDLITIDELPNEPRHEKTCLRDLRPG